MTRQDVEKIVVVRLGAMGDILFTTPALRGLKARYPQSSLTYVALKKWAFLFRNSPTVDRFVGLSYREPKALGRVGRESFDLLVNFHETEDGARVCQALDARERRGHQWIDSQLVPDEHSALLVHDKPTLMRLYKEGLSYPELFCRIAGVESEDSHRYDFVPGRWAAWCAARFFHSRGLDRGDAPIALHTHSRGMPSKEWPAESVLAAIRALPERRFIVLGYPPDRDRTRIFESRPNTVVSYHSMPIQAEILRSCALFVGIDSGPRQVAAAVGTRVLCLFGPRPPELLASHPKDRALTVDVPCAPCFDTECARGEACLDRIALESIVEAIREMTSEA